MDYEEEFSQFSDSEKQPSLVPERRLKRLRKANEISPKDHLPSDDAPLVREANSTISEALDRGENNGEDFQELNNRSESQLECLHNENKLDSGFDCLDLEKGTSGGKRSLEFGSVVEEYHGRGGDQMGTDPMGVEVEGDSGELRTEQESAKKRLNVDELEDKQEKKKKKKRVKNASDDPDEMSYSAISTKRRGDKERRDRLRELRSESQRLLRETRDASFKPVPVVQKSVSSVLEKIRQRKHELSKNSVITNRNSSLDGNDSISRELILDFDTENSPFVDLEYHKAEEADSRYTSFADVEDSLDTRSAEISQETTNDSHKNVTSKMDLDGASKQKFRAPVDDTQDIIFDSQTSDSKDEMPGSPLEEVMRPSLLAMNLKLDSAPDDFSSDEEENDKENIDPCLQGSADLSSSPAGDPVKAFVDDEAEEEDDSDNDLACFQDNEEDEDNIDPEELNDMIATEYEERPIDDEMRNELHQKWLEQQDAAGTENILQRLKCGSKQREKTFIEEKGDWSEEGGKEFLDDPEEYLVPKNAVRMNLKKAKEMIPLTFTDKDVYVSSDDEETERCLAKQRLSDKAGYHHNFGSQEKEATFLSPAEDEGSREIFGLVKKLNSVPDTKRKAKTTSHFHMLSIGGNRTVSSKSSFLSRGSKNSLPSFQKQGPTIVRSFVFERDDSNSRSAISEDSANLVQRESRPKKAAPAKFRNSQVRSSTQNTQTMPEKGSGPSLHELLRCPSLQSSNCVRGSMAGQVEDIYAAFKLDQNLVKREPNVSIRS